MKNRRVRLPRPVLLCSLICLGAAPPSSHREGPFVTENPKVDATDFYMFTSYEAGREDFVTLVANYLPLQDPYGGPNYFTLDPEAAYDIHVDNDGDSVEDLTFRFRFESRFRNLSLVVGDEGETKTVGVPLRNIGPVGADSLGALNEGEFFSLTLLEGRVQSPTKETPIQDRATGAVKFAKPLDNIGAKSIPDYESYADSFIYEIALPGGETGRLFVGQRADPFVVNLGETFDLVNLDPLGPVDAKENSLADKNVTSLVLELPKSFLAGSTAPVVGAWTSASLPRLTQLLENPTFGQPTRTSPELQQVSRLGMPLVNEVVIGLGDKNRFNASRPSGDTQFLNYVTHPTLPELLEILFGVTAPNLFPRADLVQVFLTGVPGLNDNGATSEMLRLNMDVPARPAAEQETLGVLAADNAGFPNGRRPGDDVVDAALRVVMGVLLDETAAPSGQLPYTDGAALHATDYLSVFPYLNSPLAGSPQ